MCLQNFFIIIIIKIDKRFYWEKKKNYIVRIMVFKIKLDKEPKKKKIWLSVELTIVLQNLLNQIRDQFSIEPACMIWFLKPNLSKNYAVVVALNCVMQWYTVSIIKNQELNKTFYHIAGIP